MSINMTGHINDKRTTSIDLRVDTIEKIPYFVGYEGENLQQIELNLPTDWRSEYTANYTRKLGWITKKGFSSSGPFGNETYILFREDGTADTLHANTVVYVARADFAGNSQSVYTNYTFSDLHKSVVNRVITLDSVVVAQVEDSYYQIRNINDVPSSHGSYYNFFNSTAIVRVIGKNSCGDEVVLKNDFLLNSFPLTTMKCNIPINFTQSGNAEIYAEFIKSQNGFTDLNATIKKTRHFPVSFRESVRYKL